MTVYVETHAHLDAQRGADVDVLFVACLLLGERLEESVNVCLRNSNSIISLCHDVLWLKMDGRLYEPRTRRLSERKPRCAGMCPSRAQIWSQTYFGEKSVTGKYLKNVVGRDGIEPPTPGFSVLCSTN